MLELFTVEHLRRRIDDLAHLTLCELRARAGFRHRCIAIGHSLTRSCDRIRRRTSARFASCWLGQRPEMASLCRPLAAPCRWSQHTGSGSQRTINEQRGHMCRAGSLMRRGSPASRACAHFGHAQEAGIFQFPKRNSVPRPGGVSAVRNCLPNRGHTFSQLFEVPYS